MAKYYWIISLLLLSSTNPAFSDHFFLTGNLHDLVPVTQHSAFSALGKITVLTQPINAEASQSIQGHLAVTSSVLRGLKKLGLSMNYNPHTIEEVGDHIFVLVNTDALQQAIELKHNGRIKTLIVGPNILGNPNQHDHILGSPEINWYIAPCNWARDCNRQEEPLINGKTAIWYAGIDTEYWQQQQKPQTKTMLVYWKTEPESFCIEIENLLHHYGWQTKRLQYGCYHREQYKQLLQEVDAAVFISVSESQGIALAECWAMDVPTFVWNPGTAFIYDRWLTVTSAPYITPATGSLWQTFDELESLLTDFDQIKIKYSPCEWVLKYMSDEASAFLLLDLIKYSL